MADQIGDDRPPSRRVPVLAVALVLLLGGYAVIRHLSAPEAAPADASPTATATTTPPATRHSAIPSPYSSAYPASAAPTPPPLAAAPWAGLAPDRRTEVDFAVGRMVHGRRAHLSAGPGRAGAHPGPCARRPGGARPVPGKHRARAAPPGREPAGARHVHRRVPAPAGRRRRPPRAPGRLRPGSSPARRAVRADGPRPVDRGRARRPAHQPDLRGPRLDRVRRGAHRGARPRRAAVPVVAGTGAAGADHAARVRRHGSVPARRVPGPAGVDGHGGGVHRAGPCCRPAPRAPHLPGAARSAGRLVALRRPDRRTRGPAGGHRARPGHRPDGAARRPAPGVHRAHRVARRRQRPRRRAHPGR